MSTLCSSSDYMIESIFLSHFKGLSCQSVTPCYDYYNPRQKGLTSLPRYILTSKKTLKHIKLFHSYAHLGINQNYVSGYNYQKQKQNPNLLVGVVKENEQIDCSQKSNLHRVRLSTASGPISKDSGIITLNYSWNQRPHFSLENLAHIVVFLSEKSIQFVALISTTSTKEKKKNNIKYM